MEQKKYMTIDGIPVEDSGREKRPRSHTQGGHPAPDLLLLLGIVDLRRMPHVHGREQVGRPRRRLLHAAEGGHGDMDEHGAAAQVPQDDPRAAARRPLPRLHHLPQQRQMQAPGPRDALQHRGRALPERRGRAAARRLVALHIARPQQVHPLRRLRQNVQRNTGRRRDRLRAPRLEDDDKHRLRHPDCRKQLRRLRSVRRGLPDRRDSRQERHREGLEGARRQEGARLRPDSARRARRDRRGVRHRRRRERDGPHSRGAAPHGLQRGLRHLDGSRPHGARRVRRVPRESSRTAGRTRCRSSPPAAPRG